MEKSKLYWLYIEKQRLLEMGVRESSICEDITEFGLVQCEMTEEQAISLIPKNTLYCGGCPFHDIIPNFPKQGNGYCHFLERGDSLNGIDLLWDGCKACGISDDCFEEQFYE